MIKNTYITDPLISNISLQSTKQDKDSHGYGIKTIKNIVDKYHGTMHYEYSIYYFTCIFIYSIKFKEEYIYLPL
ncbi:hypothetical protein HMPREF9943_01448 [Eggerthia catenaformis OT 569 = DSM 20559]|uniref:Sensor histidine kinase NatK-like C-terminal domain-containing protein n=1 Tax=Eggerthia catenaformis OT 569 = DSM 20559 TaxID=999415 RepID=M2PL05_9FIRM|nr:GHKL domain-containing protein [Eggerthia catenaformis]EMD16269.1 hypothetical protein HMPREF9943_01448 [Eggerthia catenaformis OT 569 = DSM 20559]